MKHSLEKVEKYLSNNNIRYRIGKYNLKDDYNKASDSLGIPVEAIVKTMVLQHKKDFLICLLSSTKKIDYEKVYMNTGAPYKLANKEVSEQLTNCKVGAISPWLLKDVNILIDSSLMDNPQIGIASGVRGCEIIVSPEDLVEGMGFQAVDLVEDI